LETHWELFNARFVEPILNGAVLPSLGQLSAKWGVSCPDRASNMIITVKRRFRETLKRCVRRTVVRDELAEGELEEILSFFPE
jgi:hypothetical protein